jgi:hypothetical protein
LSLVLGAVGAVVAWIALEFLGKPFRAFFDLKKAAVEALTDYGNVGTRPVVLNDDHLFPKQIPGEERRQTAAAAFRTIGSKFDGFARTEVFAVLILRMLKYDPQGASRGFIGFSNTIGDASGERYANRLRIESALKLRP